METIYVIKVIVQYFAFPYDTLEMAQNYIILIHNAVSKTVKQAVQKRFCLTSALYEKPCKARNAGELIHNILKWRHQHFKNIS